jgi:hypothetical protein
LHKHLSIYLLTGLILCWSAGTATAQQTPLILPEGQTDTVEYTGPPVSPRGAFFRSVLIPGWGQTYVGAPGRGVVYFTLFAGSAYMSYVSRRQLYDARQQEDWLHEIGELKEDEDSGFVLAREQQFEDWAALSIFLLFFSGADAYVAAYLSDFDDRIGISAADANSLEFRVSLPLGSP